jgi:hypothetical protein
MTDGVMKRLPVKGKDGSIDLIEITEPMQRISLNPYGLRLFCYCIGHFARLGTDC